MKKGQPILVGLVAWAALAVPTASTAQLMPGFIEPAKKVDAMRQAHMLCFLAVADRPAPGLNMDMPEGMGEGHFVEPSAPAWLSSLLEFEPGTSFSRATSAEGDIWLAFEPASGRCTIAAETNSADSMRATFEEAVFSRGDWKKKKDKSAAGYFYRIKLAGLEFQTEYPDLAQDHPVFVVQVDAD